MEAQDILPLFVFWRSHNILQGITPSPVTPLSSVLSKSLPFSNQILWEASTSWPRLPFISGCIY